MIISCDHVMTVILNKIFCLVIVVLELSDFSGCLDFLTVFLFHDLSFFPFYYENIYVLCCFVFRA